MGGSGPRCSLNIAARAPPLLKWSEPPFLVQLIKMVILITRKDVEVKVRNFLVGSWPIVLSRGRSFASVRVNHRQGKPSSRLVDMRSDMGGQLIDGLIGSLGMTIAAPGLLGHQCEAMNAVTTGVRKISIFSRQKIIRGLSIRKLAKDVRRTDPRNLVPNSWVTPRRSLSVPITCSG